MSVELELRGISKRYPGVVANDAIDLMVTTGEVHAIVGENGAGKSTLMSILYGLVIPDEGEILVRNNLVKFRSPLDAMDCGLGMVHQSFQLFPTMSVAENVVYGNEPRKGLLIDRAFANETVSQLAKDFGLGVDVKEKIEDLGVGTLQRVEILKALFLNARVLILDEPTAVLTPQERTSLFEVIDQLRSNGKTIIFITHKLNEVMAIGDRVTVLRQGRVVSQSTVSETSPAEMSLAMTGRQVDTGRRHPENKVGKTRLSLNNLDVVDASNVRRVSGVNLTVAAGEVVGIAGVTGSGQTELVEAILGLRPVSTGEMTLDGYDLTRLTVRGRRDAGLSYVPEDRQRVGSAGSASTAENLLMGSQRKAKFHSHGWLRRKAINTDSKELINSFGIAVSGPDQLVRELSGGNLQKVVVARELSLGSSMLVVEQPTRGVDVGAIEFIHDHIIKQRDAGCGVLLVSAELSEILALSTRVLVMFQGRIVVDLDPKIVDESEIGLYMTGLKTEITNEA